MASPSKSVPIGATIFVGTGPRGKVRCLACTEVGTKKIRCWEIVCPAGVGYRGRVKKRGKKKGTVKHRPTARKKSKSR